jgi:hypothetical protein
MTGAVQALRANRSGNPSFALFDRRKPASAAGFATLQGR